MKCAIGIDLGGTNIKAAAYDFNGKCLKQEIRPTLDMGRVDEAPKWADTIRQVIHHFESECGPSVIGIAAPGLAEPNGRWISYMPGRLQGLERFDWSAFLGHKEGVRVLNDAHAALLGEVWQGAGVGCQNVVLLTLGTGVGGAISCSGKLLEGSLGRAGHLGHVSLDIHAPQDITRIPGSLEDAIGECTIQQRSGGRFETTLELVEAYRSGNAKAADIWLESIRALGCAIASFINVLDPEVVLIGGGIAEAGESLFQPLEKVLDEVEWRPGGGQVPIRKAMLGEWSGSFGAAWRAIEKYL